MIGDLLEAANFVGIIGGAGLTIGIMLSRFKSTQKQNSENTQRIFNIEKRMLVLNDDHIPKKDFNEMRLKMCIMHEDVKRLHTKLEETNDTVRAIKAVSGGNG